MIVKHAVYLHENIANGEARPDGPAGAGLHTSARDRHTEVWQGLESPP